MLQKILPNVGNVFKILLEFAPVEFNWHQVSIGLGNGLLPKAKGC